MADANFTPYGVIYCIEHRDTGMRYIGQTVQGIRKRWIGHKACSSCVRLHRAILKYGESAFDIYELDAADSKENLDALEDFYIRLFDTTNRSLGYNLRGGGSFGKQSDESRKKMSDKVIFAYENTNLKKRRSDAQKGKLLNQHQKLSLLLANLGKKHSQETIEKLSDVRRKLWKEERVRENMQRASIEARKSEGYKAKVADNAKRQWSDPVQRQILIDARKATQDAGNAVRQAVWNDPEKKAARLAKLSATWERKKAEKSAQT